ncbi:MAG: WecB/TagA/CpsF family glycosyltransferase [Clostridia bacterium]|nr:WecB/TagA/CpsF family glycosyltransferase [Clostridia bacterium]
MKQYFERLFSGTKKEYLSGLRERLLREEKTFVVTANPEAFMFGETDPEVHAILTDSKVDVVADGIGIVKGAGMLGITLPERIPGVDIAEALMQMGHEEKKSIFLLGAKEEVLEAMKRVLAERFPDLVVKGAINGYVPDKDAAMDEICKAAPDIVLVALGIPAQEKLIYRHLSDFKKGIFVGVGGSLDVLSGTKERAPQFFIKHNLEWAYRIAKEPKRLKRFYNSNVKFIFKVRKEAKKK